MCDAMKRFLANPIPPEHIEEQAKQMSWDNYAKAILN
jgi:hypothetical protein